MKRSDIILAAIGGVMFAAFLAAITLPTMFPLPDEAAYTPTPAPTLSSVLAVDSYPDWTWPTNCTAVIVYVDAQPTRCVAWVHQERVK